MPTYDFTISIKVQADDETFAEEMLSQLDLSTCEFEVCDVREVAER